MTIYRLACLSVNESTTNLSTECHQYSRSLLRWPWCSQSFLNYNVDSDVNVKSHVREVLIPCMELVWLFEAIYIYIHTYISCIAFPCLLVVLPVLFSRRQWNMSPSTCCPSDPQPGFVHAQSQLHLRRLVCKSAAAGHANCNNFQLVLDDKLAGVVLFRSFLQDLMLLSVGLPVPCLENNQSKQPIRETLVKLPVFFRPLRSGWGTYQRISRLLRKNGIPFQDALTQTQCTHNSESLSDFWSYTCSSGS